MNYRTFIATVLTLAFTITGLTAAQARAEHDDIGRLVANIATAAILGTVIADPDDYDRRGLSRDGFLGGELLAHSTRRHDRRHRHVYNERRHRGHYKHKHKYKKKYGHGHGHGHGHYYDGNDYYDYDNYGQNWHGRNEHRRRGDGRDRLRSRHRGHEHTDLFGTGRRDRRNDQWLYQQPGYGHQGVRPLPQRVNRMLLPAGCETRARTRNGVEVQGFGARCLQRHFAFSRGLPGECAVRTRTRNGERQTLYGSRCLHSHGYRVR